MSNYLDYLELKNFVYELYKDGVWETLSQEIKRLYWCDLKRLSRRAKSDTDNGSLSLEQAYEELGYEPVDPFSIEDYVIQQETKCELYAAIETLDELDRNIIDLYYFKGETERQIEQELGIKQRTINDHKNKSQKAMKKILEKNQ